MENFLEFLFKWVMYLRYNKEVNIVLVFITQYEKKITFCFCEDYNWNTNHAFMKYKNAKIYCIRKNYGNESWIWTLTFKELCYIKNVAN